MTTVDVTMSVNATHLHLNAKELLDSLTPEHRKDIAQKLLLDWLNVSAPIERTAYESRVIGELRQSSSYYRDKSDKEIRNGYSFGDKMHNYKSPHEIFVSAITTDVLSLIRSEAKDAIDKSPEIQSLRAKMLVDLPDLMMKAMHEATLQWMMQNLHTIGNAISAERLAQLHASMNGVTR